MAFFVIFLLRLGCKLAQEDSEKVRFRVRFGWQNMSSRWRLETLGIYLYPQGPKRIGKAGTPPRVPTSCGGSRSRLPAPRLRRTTHKEGTCFIAATKKMGLDRVRIGIKLMCIGLTEC
jgi:hypothetical protein